MKSMKIAVFLVLIIAEQSYGRTRCSGYPPCRKSPIACSYGNVMGVMFTFCDIWDLSILCLNFDVKHFIAR